MAKTQLDPMLDVAAAASAANATSEDLKQAKSTLIKASFELTADLTTVGAQQSRLQFEKNRLRRELQNGEATALSATETRIREIDNQLTSLAAEETSIRRTIDQTLTRTADIEKQLQLQEVAPAIVAAPPENSQAANLPSSAEPFPVAPQGQQPVTQEDPNFTPSLGTGPSLNLPPTVGDEAIAATTAALALEDNIEQTQLGAGLSGPSQLIEQDLPNFTPSLGVGPAIKLPPTVGDEAIAAADEAGRQNNIEQTQLGAGVNSPQTVAASNQSANASTTQVRVESRDEVLDTANKDWRFRISLAPGAQYFYNIAAADDILRPLKDTSGVIFPYTPQISVTYGAAYEPVDLTHANYRSYNYKNSYVDSVNITGDFTAQDTHEANYVLAVIHFFRSVTKMWYGKDETPIRGTPPPLCYLSGHGAYAFDLHPVVITSFTLNYPTDVDYINASQKPIKRSGELVEYNKPTIGRAISPLDRLKNAGLAFGGKKADKANIKNDIASKSYSNIDNNDVTRVPTRLQITLTAQPIVTRNTISNNFSLKEYATGKLLRGRLLYSKNGGGIW